MKYPRPGLSSLALSCAAALVAGVVLPLACGGGQATGGPGGGHGTASGGTATGGSGGGSGCTLGALCDGGSPEGGQLGCSADLRSVVDGQGTVVMTCPDDQGCSGGACIAACAAAEASQGNVGCDFLVPTPPSYPPDLPPCFAVFVANAWPAPAALTVSFGGMSYDATQFGRIPQDGMPESTWAAVPATGGIGGPNAFANARAISPQRSVDIIAQPRRGRCLHKIRVILAGKRVPAGPSVTAILYAPVRTRLSSSKRRAGVPRADTFASSWRRVG